MYEVDLLPVGEASREGDAITLRFSRGNGYVTVLPHPSSHEPVPDEWLRRYAGQSRRRDTAATSVTVEASGVLVAYASVASTDDAGSLSQFPNTNSTSVSGESGIARSEAQWRSLEAVGGGMNLPTPSR